MRKVVVAVVAVAAVLAALHALFETKEGPLVLAYKFREGQCDTYRVAMKLRRDASFFGVPSGKSPQSCSIRTLQRVQSVDRDGSARVVVRMTPTGWRGAYAVPFIGESLAMTISKTGKVIESKDLKLTTGGLLPGLEYTPIGPICLGGVLPSCGVAVGSSWTEENPFPLGGGNVHVTATLVSDSYKLGKRRVCRIDNTYEGKIDLRKMHGKPQRGMTGDLEIKGSGTIYFSRKEGKLIKSRDTMTVTTNMRFGKASGSGGASMAIKTVAQIDSNTQLIELRKVGR